MVAALVALARKHFPKIDGLIVIPLAVVIGVAICFALQATLMQNPTVVRGARVAVLALGGTSFLSYIAGKVGSVAASTTLPPPPPPPVEGGSS